MSKGTVFPLTADDYDQLARDYYQTLPLEHFMENTDAAAQRMIAVESLELVKARRPEVQIFSELLVQYPRDDEEVPVGRVCPNNMVTIDPGPQPKRRTSYATELEAAPILWVLEWVSGESKTKDYGESFQKYERELKVPYCLQFHPEKQDLRFYHHNGTTYDRLQLQGKGRYALPELDLEFHIVDGWIRFWFQGNLLELPKDLIQHLEIARQQAKEADQRAEQERQRAEQERQRAEQERQRAEQERQRAEQAEAENTQLRALLAKIQDGNSPRNGPGN